jgi:hypothetical protein
MRISVTRPSAKKTARLFALPHKWRIIVTSVHFGFSVSFARSARLRTMNPWRYRKSMKAVALATVSMLIPVPILRNISGRNFIACSFVIEGVSYYPRK